MNPIRACLLALLVIGLLAGGPLAVAQAPSPTPSVGTAPPAEIPQLPERDWRVTVVAGLAIVVAAGAGLFIYSMIRKGI